MMNIIQKKHYLTFLIDENHCIRFSIQLILSKNKPMLLTSLIIVFCVTLIYLLLMPVIIYINTDKNQYYLQLRGLIKVSVETHEKEVIQLKLRMFFLNFYFYPLNSISKKEKKKKVNKHHMMNVRTKIGFKKGLRILKSFTIERLLVNVDTGNCILNAKLYPVFVFLNYHFGGFNINFKGENKLVVHIQNRPINIIKSFINI